MADRMLIDVDGGWIELYRPSADDTTDDLLLEVTARVEGFQGFVETWVATEAWRAFTEGLTQLEAARQGEATLESMSPGELVLTIGSTDAAGHMAASGRLSRDGGKAKLSMAFGPCAFDPSTLPQLVRASRRLVR